jgi:hypothetical protein
MAGHAFRVDKEVHLDRLCLICREIEKVAASTYVSGFRVNRELVLKSFRTETSYGFTSAIFSPSNSSGPFCAFALFTDPSGPR